MSFDDVPKEEWDRLQKLLRKEDSAWSDQVAGDHYKTLPVQPAYFCQVNKIPFIESSIIKYVCRWKQKNGIQDLEKVKHYVNMLIEMEQS